MPENVPKTIYQWNPCAFIIPKPNVTSTSAGGYKCGCDGTGFAGPRCEEEIDMCQSSPCLNGQICQNSIGSYSCRCPANYEGPNCESYCKSFLKANRVQSVSKNSFGRSACSNYCIDIKGDVFFHTNIRHLLRDIHDQPSQYWSYLNKQS